MTYDEFIKELITLKQTAEGLKGCVGLARNQDFIRWLKTAHYKLGLIREYGYGDEYVRTFLDRRRSFSGQNNAEEDFSYELDVTIAEFEGIINHYQQYGDPKKRKTSNASINSASKNVFIVHGHDEFALEQVKNCIYQVNLFPIVLSDEASSGKTIIEKFEEYTVDICYAVVLYTPDDKGGSNSGEELQQRARENVVFELGYLYGKYGRRNVCLLYKPPARLPSDLHGIAYVDMTQSDWRSLLIREMSKQGIPVDANLLK